MSKESPCGGSGDVIQQNDYKLKLSFKAEWTDWAMSATKHFILFFYPCDESIEMYDVDAKKMFLRRSFCKGVSLKDMFVGSTVRVYSRQVELVDYADAFTRDRISVEKEHTFALVKPSAMDKLGEILNVIHRNCFSVVRMKQFHLSRYQAITFYEDKKGEMGLAETIEHIASGPTVALELVGRDAVNRWRKLIGPSNPADAKLDAPQSLRALYGIDLAANGFHGASSHDCALREACYFFPQGLPDRKAPPTPLLMKNSTLCLIKPHVIAEGKLGDVFTAIIASKFRFNALQLFYLNAANAEEFLEVYKGVVSDFHALVLSLQDGPVIAMEMCAKNPEEEGFDVHQEFRKFAGPPDPDVARQIRPETLRAKFGVDKTLNAVHCTDLPEDVELELDYFFKILIDL